MIHRAENKTRHRRVQLQMVVLLLLFTLLTTSLTGWIIYDRTSDQVIRDTWQQQEALLRSTVAAVNREIEQVKSFSWQISNDSSVQKYLHLTEETPKDILTKRGIIEKLQQMKAFSNTMADIGIYAEGMDIIITGESSYRAADYYSRIDGITLEKMIGERSVPGTVALGRYAGNGTVSRILSKEPVLVFVSSLPLNAQAGKSYAFFQLNADRLYACLPESDAGTLLLTDGEGTPVIQADTEDSGAISRQYVQEKQNRIRYNGSEYGVLSMETAAEGLHCTAVIPYSELLKPSLRLRDVVMLVMGICMVAGLLAAVLASKRLYAPLERLLGNVRQLCRSLPDDNRGNEYKMLEDAIHLISAENHELTLSNREVNRLLKNRLLNDWMEGKLKGDADETLAKAGVTLPYDLIQIAVAETAPRDLERLEARNGENTADRIETLAAKEPGDRKVWCARRTDGLILILFNLNEQPAAETAEELLQSIREQVFGECPCTIGLGRVCEKEKAAEALVDAMIDLRSGEESREEKHYTRLTDYIRKEYMNDISLDSASEALDMSPSYIGLVFRKVGGTSFLKYLTDIRMEETKRLLTTTELTLREIGQQVGIENQNTLIRTFKKATGVTPGQYRVSNQAMHSQNG
ncbi:helix-turn-helix domain-containing protein [Aristaeella hokkaidonensis]|uniref:Helix-turn-helix domain-containing protein n=1 Tax=Aristaeella hokkaidonensis TaxID=3046382 RepID=A0AC61MWZ9_9FIRM|nr:helix-turn-helix domain-containing protein [Aristaeella hokkaidonensis]QUC67385.1 helix-turn-helix domain-containing protein [Aristaeella hokkaidonensis]SNT93276.1 AraC-type DNA-binding protein [Aristaeella hokkaidonensis]